MTVTERMRKRTGPPRTKPAVFSTLQLEEATEAEASAGRDAVALRWEAEQAKAAERLKEAEAEAKAAGLDVFDEAERVEAAPLRRMRLEKGGEPRYVELLKAAAEERRREREAAEGRRILREKLEMAEEIGEKEQFVTESYRRRLEENKRWEDRQKEISRRESEEDVVKRGHMMGFYSGMLRSSESMGNARDTTLVNVKKQVEESTEQRRQVPFEEHVDKETLASKKKPLKEEEQLVPKKRPAPEVDRQKMIETARERYLRRKQQKEQT